MEKKIKEVIEESFSSLEGVCNIDPLILQMLSDELIDKIELILEED